MPEFVLLRVNMGFLRDFVSQSNLTGDVALRTWYGEYHPWRRIAFYCFLYGFASALQTVLFFPQFQDIPLLNPKLNETTLKGLKRKHASCMEALCADAKTVVATCDIHEYSMAFDLKKYRQSQNPTVLEMPKKCLDAIAASFGPESAQDLLPFFSLDPNYPALISIDGGCSFHLNLPVFFRPGSIPLSTILEINIFQGRTSTVSPASLVCPDRMHRTFKSDLPHVLEVYDWILSPYGRALIRNACLTIIAGLDFVTTLMSTVCMAMVCMVVLIPQAVVLKAACRLKEPLKLWDILVSLLLLVFLTVPFNNLDTDEEKRDFAVKHLILMVISLGFLQVRVAFEWWFLMMFQLGWEGEVPVLDKFLSSATHWPLVGPIMSPFLHLLMRKDLRKIALPFYCAVFRSRPRQGTREEASLRPSQ